MTILNQIDNVFLMLKEWRSYITGIMIASTKTFHLVFPFLIMITLFLSENLTNSILSKESWKSYCKWTCPVGLFIGSFIGVLIL